MRDEFEAWWRSAEVLKSKRAVAFDAWQASRAALMVELPAKRSYSMYVTKHECHAFNDAIEKAKEALQQAGIEVK
ncbi:hypothetical protein PAK_P100171c [Pseudomonas phage PAK_P1]|uniref:Uncharacterized protein n=3 Tax=Pakpunavirus TaxID=1921407 RepID=V5K308_9CAUD|nr:hypothetical protein PaP1_gp039 [Pseudomonas phage PaP1]YP_008869208.1 hypothetical protein PAK_P100171c [Pseudomonas phage PAK_P1]YP_009224735.1 hypothetical protein PaoP5_043 [Pseudomonas phage PaoP5]YP_010765103.1 hypothetical protein QE346_gp007 [Pseudomonas phage phipa10]KEH08738.1 hypothetical protein GY14_17805 [Delftia tsuruhatensis]KEH12939.1 hypothetical protein GY15_16305 [Delftia sp. 670]AEK21579.1 hypothetical protein PaP1_gp039 [Pseudomonas phage PaP1]AGS81798.1 hypothetical